MRGGVVLAALASVIWLGALPPPQTWSQLVKGATQVTITANTR